MNAGTAMVDHESRAEAAYTAMYDAARHSVKDYYEDARVHLAHAIEIATGLGLNAEAEQLKKLMTKLLEEAVALLGALPEVEQDRAAQVLFAFTRELNDYELDAEQLAGIDHAMGQADRGDFASDKRVSGIFYRPL